MTRFRLSALACLRGLIGLGLVSSGSLFGAGSTGSVTITGTAEVGQTLTADNNLAFDQFGKNVTIGKTPGL